MLDFLGVGYIVELMSATPTPTNGANSMNTTTQTVAGQEVSTEGSRTEVVQRVTEVMQTATSWSFEDSAARAEKVVRAWG